MYFITFSILNDLLIFNSHKVITSCTFSSSDILKSINHQWWLREKTAQVEQMDQTSLQSTLKEPQDLGDEVSQVS